jgi:hypothetical protein
MTSLWFNIEKDQYYAKITATEFAFSLNEAILTRNKSRFAFIDYIKINIDSGSFVTNLEAL